MKGDAMPALGLLLGLLLAMVAATSAAATDASKEPATIPPIKDGVVKPQPAISCRPAAFRAAETAGASGSRWLKVTYVVPDLAGVPLLVPLVYVKAPEYWQLNFQFCSGTDGVNGILPNNPAQYMPSLPGSVVVAEFSLVAAIGLKGIDLVGSSSLMRKRFDITP